MTFRCLATGIVSSFSGEPSPRAESGNAAVADKAVPMNVLRDEDVLDSLNCGSFSIDSRHAYLGGLVKTQKKRLERGQTVINDA